MKKADIIIASALDDAIEEIRSNSRAAGQVVTGKTLKSLYREVVPEADGYTARLYGRAYFGALETGSGPARKRGTDAELEEFQRNLEEWCRIRGFPSSGLTPEQLTRVAKWLRWRLNKYGSRLYRKGGRKDIFTPAVENFEERLTEQLTSFYSTEVENLFTEGFQGFGNSPQ